MGPTLHQRIQKRAFELWEKRGRPLWSSLDDWLEAERQVLAETDSPIDALRGISAERTSHRPLRSSLGLRGSW